MAFDYIAETDKTASNVFSPENVGIIEFTSALAAVIHAAQEMDKFKKALFRKRTREESGLGDLSPVDIDLCKALGHGDPDRGMQLAEEYDNLFHGIIGAMTEVGEMAEILLRLLDRDELPDRTNVREEIGDVLWYLARLVKYADTTFIAEMHRNIEKLRLRHGSEGFSKGGDINRDLGAERAVLEGHQEHDAVMTAAGHLPEGDGQEHSEVMRAIRGG